MVTTSHPSRLRTQLRLAVVSTVRLCLDGLLVVLADEQGLLVELSGSPSGELLTQIGARELDAAVVDLGSRQGLAFVAELSSSHPSLPVVAIAVQDTPEQLLACARYGVAAFIPSSGSKTDLLEALRGLRDGEFVCSKRSAAMLYRQLQRMAGQVIPQRGVECLTLREREVLGHIGLGRSNKEIAGMLSIELATVKNHVHHILEKLKVQSRGQAAALLAHGEQGCAHESWANRP